ncbi:RNA polymerase sigma factor [Aquisphaera giovannonii]|uniref:RNA polymerase sigma factor n=1 Tax=Aquisphaera giovannonii TaxID=406548 RepID=A0A5B9W3A7_9BACT|nr:sigma factor-like helix-turn-helix DNA-binding protein [Aquisphaera giovannonii]QEH35096.1 RNA polymerase sigma factor [Aquisphaera giovannonii]
MPETQPRPGAKTPPPPDVGDLDGFRDYLRALTWKWIPADLRGRVDPSDLIQETLLRAHRDRDRFRGGEAEAEAGAGGDAGPDARAAARAGWLKQILAARLADRLRELGRARGVSLHDLDRSSAGMEHLIPACLSTPSAGLQSEEKALLVARLLARLPREQAEAIVLKHCEGLPVQDVARHMNRSPQAIGGLLRRGLRTLRELAATRDFEDLRPRTE